MDVASCKDHLTEEFAEVGKDLGLIDLMVSVVLHIINLTTCNKGR